MALAFAPALTAAGTFLAIALRQGERFIGRLYAADLLAGPHALPAIPLMRTCCKVPRRSWCCAPRRRRGAPALSTPVDDGARRPPDGRERLGAGAHLATGGAFLALPLEPEPTERWNEHSRIVAYERSEDPHSGIAVIDKSAGTFLPAPVRAGPAIPCRSSRGGARGSRRLAYRAGRPMPRVAIIGVGGAATLSSRRQAEHVDG
ncbi:MAG: hypothetical protein U0166_18600 [Acidobacteriota bacterium]